MRKRDPVVNVGEPRRRVEMNNVGINRALNVIRSSVSSYRDQGLVFEECHDSRNLGNIRRKKIRVKSKLMYLD